MKYLLFLLIITLGAASCNPQTKQQEETPQAYAAAEQRVKDKADTQEQPPQLNTDAETDENAEEINYMWTVDVIWYGEKVIGGSGPFPTVDTITLYMEDANVPIFWPKRPSIKVIQKQAKPPIAGYKFLGIQDMPQLVGTRKKPGS